jgi:hypothetical protein
MKIEYSPNGSVSSGLLTHGEAIELGISRAEAEQADANKLLSLHQNRGEVVEAKKSGTHPLFMNSFPHLRREHEANRMYPGTVEPLTRANG